MKHKLTRNSLIISAVVTLLTALLYWQGAFVGWENRSLDLRFQLRGAQKSKAPVAIAQIDDDSLQTIGKWPWPRKIHARLLDVLRRAGAKAVVFDVLFLEPDRYEPANDRVFAQALQRNGRAVIGYDFKLQEEEVVEQDAKGNAAARTVSTVVKEDSLPKVTQAARAQGFVNCWPDPDGYLRRGELTYAFQGSTYPSMNLQAVALAEGKPPLEVLRGVPVTRSSAWDNPTDEVLVNWRGPEQGTFDAYSCTKILDAGIPDDWKEGWFKDKIVLIGSTALGLYDHYPMPFSGTYPGLYYHANMIDNLLLGEYLRPVGGLVTLFLILAFGLAGGLLVIRTEAWLGALSTFLGLALYWAAAYWLLARRLSYLELVAPSLSWAGNYLAVFFYRFIVEQREKAGIKKAFGVYVNPHVVDQIAKNPDALKLGGEMREMTVMFSDVAGFTSISEKLSPQELVQLLNLYLTAMTDTIMKYDGTVDKYEGDAIMAFWGAPLLQPQHARQACLAVLENRQRLAELNAELEKKGMNRLAARCGLNAGPMNVGNMGSTQKFNYTVMGDSVNLASRLEGANKQYGTHLMVSESAYEQAKDAVEVRELDLLKVKGKNIPIKVFELVGKKGELSDPQKKGFELFHQGLELYRKRKFKDALKKFQQVSEFLADDGPSATYLRRTKDYIETPPSADWDGAYVMTTK